MVFRMIYGYRVQTTHDPYVEAANEMMEKAESAMMAGWLVDFAEFRKLSFPAASFF